MAVPATVYQSTTFAAEIVCSAYPPEIWTGELRLSKAGESDISIAGTSTGDGKTHAFTALPAATALWVVGAWNWSFIVTDGTDTFLVQRGGLAVEEIGGSATELEQAKDYLAQVRSALGSAQGKVSSYSIKDRSLTNRSISELIQLESYWQRRVNDLTIANDLTCASKVGNRRITYGAFNV